MKVIFLDIDGVLVNRASFQLPRTPSDRGSVSTAHPDCVAALNKIVKATGAQIVISSVWRLFLWPDIRGVSEAWGLVGTIRDRTPDLNSVERGVEIQAWISDFERKREALESFVILDDDGDMVHLKHRLIQTSFEQGLTVEEADRAIMLLLSPTDTDSLCL